MEKPRPASELVRDLDTHDAQVEELSNQMTGNRPMLIHFAHEGRDLTVGELTNAIAEQYLVVCQGRNGPAAQVMASSWTGHRADNVIIENFGIRPRDPGFDLKPESDLWFTAFGHCADPGTGTRWNRESLGCRAA